MMGGRLGLAFVSCCCVLLAGCATVPTNGQVRGGDEAPAGANQRAIGIRVGPPPPGVQPSALIQGFLEAMQADDTNKEVARTYLTGPAAAAWDPQQQAVVYDDNKIVTFLAADPARKNSYLLAAPKVGQLDQRGSWTAADDPRFSISFTVQQVNGQWRLAGVPNGIVLPSTWVQSHYQSYNLYFLEPTTQTVLVPDPILIPQTGQEANQLIKALLAGPTRYLGPSPSSALNLAPEGTAVNVAVTVDDSGIATVPLNSPPTALSPDQRKLFAAQVVRTLRQVPGVTGVRITVDGARFDVPDSGEILDIATGDNLDPAAAAGPQLFALDQEGYLVTVSTDGTDQVARVGANDFAAESFAVAAAARQYAIVMRRDKSVLIESLPPDPQPPGRVPTEGQVLPPSFDLNGNLWILDRHVSGARLRVRQPGGTLENVSAPALSGRNISSFAVSVDGVRVLAAISDPARSQVQLVIGRVTRMDGRLVIPADSMRVLPTRLNSISKAVWAANDRVAVLGRSSPNARPQVQLVSIDGYSDVQVTADVRPDPTQLAASVNPDAPMVLGTTDRTLFYQLPDQRWYRVVGNLSQPAFPG